MALVLRGFLSTAVNGLRLSKTVCTPGEVRDMFLIFHRKAHYKEIIIANNSPNQTVCEQPSEGYSCVSLHFTQQKATALDCEEQW